MTSPLTTLTITEARARFAGLSAVLFDLDGVLTPTAGVHMQAWSRLFTPYLEARGVTPGYSDEDYFRYIDGRPRYDGVRDLLRSRGIHLLEGTVQDAPTEDTVCGLGNRKNSAFNETLAESGVSAYPGSIAFLETVAAAGYAVAVVSSSRNAEPVLVAAGLRDRFEVVVDGLVAVHNGIAGKPSPATYEYAAELLGLTPAECVVVEDAHSGVKAGRDGDFGLVLGVNRGVGAQALLDSGAHVVVDDLHDFLPIQAREVPA